MTYLHRLPNPQRFAPHRDRRIGHLIGGGSGCLVRPCSGARGNSPRPLSEGRHAIHGQSWFEDNAPARELRLDSNTYGRLLKIVVLLLGDGIEFVIYAMKAKS